MARQLKAACLYIPALYLPGKNKPVWTGRQMQITEAAALAAAEQARYCLGRGDLLPGAKKCWESYIEVKK